MSRLALSSACLLLAAALAAAQDWAEHWARRVAGFRAENARLEPGKRHVVLVGDSLTEGFEGRRTARFLPELAGRVLNRGIASDGTGVGPRGVLRRLEESVFACAPSHVALLIGVNDLGGDGGWAAPAAEKQAQAVREIRARLPEVVLIVVTLAPARGDYAHLNPRILAFNERVRATAREAGAVLLDLHPAFADEQGALRAELASRDGLHWSDAAYARYGQELQGLVREHPGPGLAGTVPR